MKNFRAVLALLILLILSGRAAAKDFPVIGVVDFTSRVTVINYVLNNQADKLVKNILRRGLQAVS